MAQRDGWAEVFLSALRRHTAALPEQPGLAFPSVEDYCGRLDQEIYAIACQATDEILEVVHDADLDLLSRHSPALKGFNWAGYLRLSLVRQVHAFAELRRRGVRSGRLLDVGAYFGNFSLTARRLGYEVTASDSYRSYGAAFHNLVPFLMRCGVEVLDTEDTGFDLEGLPEACVDVVLCMGVIEHVPHTPRPLFDAIGRALRPGGYLVLDTPNLHYIYKQIAMVRGQPLLSPMQQQYFTELPYQGHHREYGRDEIEWMMAQAGYGDLSIDSFCYSILAMSEVAGDDLVAWRAMANDPVLREVILACGRKNGPVD